ncbi:MAG: hypothetical protein ACP5U0_06935 [Caldisphaera sp.]
MKVVLVIDVLNGHNGTVKVMRNIAYGIASRNELKVIFFGRSRDYQNVLRIFDGFDYKFFDSGFLGKVEKLLLHSFLRFHTNIREDDVTSFLNQFLLQKFLKDVSYRPDLIIYSSPLSSLYALFNGDSRNVVFLHESPTFDDFALPIRKVLQFYIRMLSHKSLFISITEGIAEKTEMIYGFKCKTLEPIGFFDYDISEKKNLILLDTRWTDDRNPFFALSLAKYLPEVRIIMHGIFPDDKLREQVANEIKSHSLNIELVSGITEADLIKLYEDAKVVMRWSADHESGPSVAVSYAISHKCIPIIDNKLQISNFIKENISEKLVVNRDPEDFARIAKIIFEDDSFYGAMVQKVTECSRKYSWTEYSERLLNKISESP